MTETNTIAPSESVVKRFLLFFITLMFCSLHAFCTDYYTVTSKRALNVRSNPSTSGRVLTQLQPGSTVEVTEIINGWAKISCNGDNYGYVSAKYIRYSHHKDSVIDYSQSVNTRKSKDWIKNLIDSETDWSGWTIFWLVLTIVLSFAGIFFYYHPDSCSYTLALIILFGSFIGVYATFASGGDIIQVEGLVACIPIILLCCAIGLGQYLTYGAILDAFDDDAVERVLPLSLLGGTVAGVLRAIWGLLDWEPDWINTCFLIGVGVLAIVLMTTAIKKEEIINGLFTVAVVCGATFFIMFEVAVIIYYTWGGLLLIGGIIALLMPSGGGGATASSSSGGGGYSSSGDMSSDNYYPGADIDWGRSGHYIDSRHFRESNGANWFRNPDGSWRKV